MFIVFHHFIVVSGKQQMEEQLQKVHTSLSSQQVVAHHLEMEKRSLEAELTELKTSLQTSHTESLALQVHTDTKKEKCAGFSHTAGFVSRECTALLLCHGSTDNLHHRSFC